MKKLFEYAVIYEPKVKKDEDEKPAVILVPITSVLAATESEAAIHAARKIPEEYADRLDQVNVAIRPF